MSLRLRLGLSAAAFVSSVASAGAADEARGETAPPTPPRSPRNEFADSRLLLAVERITGVIGWYTSSTHENDFGRFERRRVGGQAHLFAATGHAGDGGDAPSFSSIPRLALDFPIGDRWTLGLTAGILGSTGSERLTIDGTEQPEISFPDVFTVQGGPRVGYALPLGDGVTFWPRVGGTYSLQRVFGAAGARQTLQAYQLSLEPTFVFSPVRNVGILLHPFVDLGLAGSSKSSFVITGLPTQSSKGSFHAHAVGVSAGLVAFF